MALAAATAGLGGGNFASSMANISFFYPDREKGFALGLNAAGGNIGVSTVQLLIPLVLGLPLFNLCLGTPQGAGHIYLQNAGLFWMPLIVIAAFGAARFMDNLTLGALELQGPAGRHAAQAHLDHGRGSTSAPSARSSATRPPSRCCSRRSSRQSR